MTGFVPPIHPTPKPDEPFMVCGVVIENPEAIPALRARTAALMEAWGFERVDRARARPDGRTSQ